MNINIKNKSCHWRVLGRQVTHILGININISLKKKSINIKSENTIFTSRPVSATSVSWQVIHILGINLNIDISVKNKIKINIDIKNKGI